jgi:hypothetical protein
MSLGKGFKMGREREGRRGGGRKGQRERRGRGEVGKEGEEVGEM